MDVERIKYQRTGGFGGMRISTDFKPDDLPDDQRNSLLELLDDVDFNELPAHLTSKSPMPDQFTYEITVETKKGAHTVTADSSAPDKLQELFRLLDRIARRKPQ